ncbi:MAG TPA: hypothetical protein VLC09_15540, partial [Polyangiaceae bacterium]|nr:hypothetical protein [Polyangiaceae bacterium]
QLLEYPYGCTEQITSRLLPLLPLGELARAYAVKLPADTKPLVEKGLADLLARQRGDGGFGMWPESRESSDWVTPYALFAVWEAKNRGFTVADSVLDMGSAYLRRQLSQAREGTTLAASTFALHVLTLLGNYDPGYATKLFEARKQLPVFSRALLLHSLAQGHPGSEEAKTLARELENQLHIEANRAAVVENLGDDYAALMDSPARSTAIVLRALLAHDPKHTLAAPLARGLLSARHDGSWRSTQETSFALLALDAYQKAREATPPSFSARFWQGDRSLLTANFQGKGARTVERSLSLAELGSEPIVFEKLGSGTLFYEARLRYARKELPREGLDRGFFVQKGLREVTADELGSGTLALSESHSTQLKAGSMVLVDLVIVSPEPRDYVVIDDPLPAGLEAVDSSFETSAAWTQISGSTASWDADEQAHGTAFQYSWYRRELRDDRVLFFVDHLPAGMYHYRYLARATTLGTFVEPPTRAEEMYSPEVFGRNGARTLEIR